MQHDHALSGVWRRFLSWLLLGAGARPDDGQTRPSASTGNHRFVAELDEAQRLAVLAVIFASKRPVACATFKD